ncbi:beta-eliminating lyase [Myriangium duriaei CBS 260.36]|uniref:Beta-eliminating lyase n=1 Tax=Myriangium duriaei CBS 260.36 TaxID=1168546 RepID=A0A9P4JBI7_9PEZI|nr:beta-eliminating lyase [Myriangium duriaei CBS 260.36]
MSKYSFTDDYSEGAHPDVLSALVKTNFSQHGAYGNDDPSEQARDYIRHHLGAPDVAVHFVPSGTSANAISIGASLRPHEAVIAANSGHIVVRETGAVEATGHKIIVVEPEPKTGKLTPAIIEQALDENWHFPHMAKPRLVYISQATEIGTIYSKAELKALRDLCTANGLLLFMDGARLPVALASPKNDLALKDVLELTDMFWIGGTKNGALLGEAIIIKDSKLAAEFGFLVKQHGCLLAKTWVMGVQFAALFEKQLYLSIAAHANRMALKLSEGVLQAGGELVADVETNQVFAILEEDLVKDLQESFGFYIWSKMENKEASRPKRVVIRLVTSWATDEEQVTRFITRIKSSRRKRHLEAGESNESAPKRNALGVVEA